jgi:hypothetical protein
MDPQAAWEAMLDAYADHEWGTATEHAEDLLSWLDRAGYPPETVEGRELRPELNRAIATAACRLIIERGGEL